MTSAYPTDASYICVATDCLRARRFLFCLCPVSQAHSEHFVQRMRRFRAFTFIRWEHLTVIQNCRVHSYSHISLMYRIITLLFGVLTTPAAIMFIPEARAQHDTADIGIFSQQAKDAAVSYFKPQVAQPVASAPDAVVNPAAPTPPTKAQITILTPEQALIMRLRSTPLADRAALAASTLAAHSRTEVALKREGGIFVVPVEINGAVTVDFGVDSGASDVSVSLDVFSTLKRTGTIRSSDIIGEQTYVLADGSRSQAVTFTIRSLKVGDKVVENVRGNVSPSRGALLLGQSFLGRFKTWSIDNKTQRLVLEPQ
jgi:clan AA aspartic protease (TIGR02281 family)